MESSYSKLINKNNKSLIPEDMLYKNKRFKNRINTFLKIDKMNQTLNDNFSTFNNNINNDNDNEEYLINTDSTIDTSKTKYIYKKKLNLSKNKINFYRPKKCFLKNYSTTQNDIKMDNNQKNIKGNLSSSNFIKMKMIRINTCLSVDKNNLNYINKMLKTCNNFYKKKKNIEQENKMSNTGYNFYKKKNLKNKEENGLEDLNIKNDINLEDLIKFEEKLNNLINSINNKIDINISNDCLELINFFNYSSLYNKFELFFNKNPQSQLIIHKSIMYIIFNAILAYYISFDKSFLNTCLDYLATIINISHKSYLLLCENIINQINNLNEDINTEKLLLILNNNLFHMKLNDKDFVKYLTARKYIISEKKINFIHEIKYYSFLIQKYIKVLLKNLSNEHNKKEDLLKIFNDMKNITLKEMYDFFQQKIKTEIIPKEPNRTKFLPTNPEIKPPYIKEELTKKFSLVLDLDETLISLDRNKASKNSKGILKLRPGLIQFLTKIRKYYEMVVFTSGTKEYADQIIDVIESDEKYFDYRLCREHTLFYNNEFIKDLSRIGRPLDKIIIVDNLPQNFRLQKENGIEIKSFFGDDNNDKALDNLGIILKKIVNRFNDVRNGILEYKNEIRNKVS